MRVLVFIVESLIFTEFTALQIEENKRSLCVLSVLETEKLTGRPLGKLKLDIGSRSARESFCGRVVRGKAQR